MDIGHSEVGTEVEIGKIDGHQKRIPAKIIGLFLITILKKQKFVLDLNG